MYTNGRGCGVDRKEENRGERGMKEYEGKRMREEKGNLERGVKGRNEEEARR